MLMGGSPPQFPGDKPDEEDHVGLQKWEKQAEKFVTYFSLLLLPFGATMDPRDEETNLPILPYNEHSWGNFTKVVVGWRQTAG